MKFPATLAGTLAVAVCGVASAVSGHATARVDASVGFLPCTPVGVDGPVPWGVPAGPPALPGASDAPNLTVVVTDVRPGRARLYLDDRYIGRADDFDGRHGALYLEPGRYVLEARLGGYRTDRFEVVADAGRTVEIRHWLERVRGEPVERAGEGPPAPFPLERVFGPQSRVAPADAVDTGVPCRREAGMPAGDAPPVASSSAQRATLRLRVVPAEARVLLDGELLATGVELDRVQTGLAVDPGRRVLEVTAPGHRPVTLELDLVAGEVTERVVELEVDVAAGTSQRD